MNYIQFSWGGLLLYTSSSHLMSHNKMEKKKCSTIVCIQQIILHPNPVLSYGWYLYTISWRPFKCSHPGQCYRLLPFNEIFSSSESNHKKSALFPPIQKYSSRMICNQMQCKRRCLKFTLAKRSNCSGEATNSSSSSAA